jgi:hypothetical protein
MHDRYRYRYRNRGGDDREREELLKNAFYEMGKLGVRKLACAFPGL